MEGFYTIEKNSECEYIEKKSKFLIKVLKVKNEEEALLHIKETKKKFWDASHNVYAYSLQENNIQRFSDDGEPSGTGGKPILEVIIKKELQDLLIIVTRYFGGTKLGASGLIRAYGKSGVLGILESGIIKKELVHEIILKINYKNSGNVEQYLNLNKIKIENVEYLEDVHIKVFVMRSLVEKTIKELIDLTNNRITIEKGKAVFI